MNAAMEKFSIPLSDQAYLIKGGAVQAPDREEMFLVKKVEDSPVLYYKFESTNNMVSDTQHDPEHPWVEITTDVPNVIKSDPDMDMDSLLHVQDEHGNSRELNVDDGCILRFEGRPTRTVAVLPNGDILAEAEARSRTMNTGRTLPRFTEWGFKLVEVTYTDGPTQRLRLAENEEKKRARSEGRMAERLGEVFDRILSRMPGSGQPTNIEDAVSSPAGLIDRINEFATDPQHARQLKEYILSELEETTSPEEEAAEEGEKQRRGRPKKE